jgi:hypothetical protein
MAQFGYPSALNTFIRDHDASNKMVVDFARNVKKFAVNNYVQVVPVKKIAGYYLEMSLEECARIISSTLTNFVWADGEVSPEFNEGTEKFGWKPFECTRYAYGFNLGDLTIDQASWDILAQHASIKARQGMTARTQLAITAMTTTTNYDSTHVLAVGSISGNTGAWDASTSARQDIRRSLNVAAELILKDTNAAVDVDDLVLVVSTGCARQMSECQEIVDYIKSSPDALAMVRGELPGRNTAFGLPDKLYGFPIIVEKTIKVTSKKGGTLARSTILPNATPFMCSRPGGLEGVANAPNFSTCVLFAQEEITVETLRDAPNRRTTGRVVDTVVASVVGPVSGVLFTGDVTY